MLLENIESLNDQTYLTEIQYNLPNDWGINRKNKANNYLMNLFV